MGGFPFDLIFAVATASATIFLGFLPTESVRSGFFARETLKATFAWVVVAGVNPPAIMHFPLFFALLCGCAWWKFSHDSALSGKMLLWLASGLGISLGVMLILAVTPRAYPANLSRTSEALLLASIYLGGAVLGIAYVSSRLAVNLSTHSGVTYATVQRYVALLVVLVTARAIVLPPLLVLTLNQEGHFMFAGHELPMTVTRMGNGMTEITFDHVQEMGLSSETLLLFGLDLILIPGLAYLAWQATRFSSRIQPTRFLVAICFFGVLAETLARLLVL